MQKIRVFSVITVLIFFFCFYCQTVRGMEELVTEDGLYYEITEADTVRITGCRESVREIAIPESIDGRTVTEIGAYAFCQHTRLVRVEIPENVQQIGDYAFLQCSRLEEISFPAGLRSVGCGIVSQTPWIERQTEEFVILGEGILLRYQGDSPSVVIPDGVRMIAGLCFETCSTRVTDVKVSSTLREVGSFGFAGCIYLKNVHLPLGLERIGTYAFHNCKSLTEVTLPESVRFLESNAFERCSSLKTVLLSSHLLEVSSNTFLNCTALETLIIPDSVRVIGQNAFYNCERLARVDLPVTVQEVGEQAFENCDTLQMVIFRNPQCLLHYAAGTFPPGAILCGFDDSTAEWYAARNGREFVELPVLRGDVDGDAMVTVEDAIWILRIYARQCAAQAVEWNARQLVAGDMLPDGKLTVEDAAAVLALYASNSAGQ